jgi:hypothetical protein
MTDLCRLIMGADGHGAYGVFATLPGHDARTADPADNLKWAFRSDWSRIENLYQVGRITGLSGASGFIKVVTFPPLPYIPFVSVRYESTPGTMQDDPWCKGNYVEQAYFTPFRVFVSMSGFSVEFPVGSSQLPASPAVPSSAVYFVWKIPVAVPA